MFLQDDVRGKITLKKSGAIWGDLGRSEAIRGDPGRSEAIWGDLGRSGAIRGDPRRNGDKAEKSRSIHDLGRRGDV